MVRQEDSTHEPAPAGAEGASSFGHRLPAGEDVLGPEELSDQGGMDRVERITDIPPPGPATDGGRRRRRASERLENMRWKRTHPQKR